MQVSLKGKSGLSHVFLHADLGAPGGTPGLPCSVTETYGREVSEYDVIGFYLKLNDAGVHRGRLVAPSFSARAKKLAEEYSLTLQAG